MYRQCAEPGCDRYFVPKSIRNRYCLLHRKTKPVDRLHDLKYGRVHRALRAQWARRVALGGVICSRCGEPIDPRASFDLDHVDGGGPSQYRGVSHSRCNRATNRGKETTAAGLALEDLVSEHRCDVCGGPRGRPLTVDDRRIWPAVASWVKSACDDCRARFERNAEKAAA